MNQQIPMRNKFYAFFVLTFGLLTYAFAADFGQTKVGAIRGPDNRPCTFFTLEGVVQADGAVPNSPWFVLKNTHPGYKENLTLLMSAKITGAQIIVSTSGRIISECGHAEVVVIVHP
jgi:hypothetical protein